MKQTFFKLRTAFYMLALSGAMISLSVPSLANNNRELLVANTDIQPTVKYLGTDDKGAIFLVQTAAAAPAKFEIRIKDKTGILLFSQVFEAANFSRSFKILQEESGNMALTFSIRNMANGDTNNYAVSTEEKTITAIAVTKTK